MKKPILILVLISGLSFSSNIVSTGLTQTVVRLHNCSNSVVIDNLITFGENGNAVAETGQCKNNYYRPIKPDETAPFDTYKY